MRVGWYIVEGDGLEAPLSFKMTQWSCYCIVLYCIVLHCIALYCIGERVCYWLEHGWRKEILWARDD